VFRNVKILGQPLLGSSRGWGGGGSFTPQPPGSDLPASPKSKVLPRPPLCGPQPAFPRPGPSEPLAVRLYGPPLRPAEASLGGREASRREPRPPRLRVDPSARLSLPHLAPSPRSGGLRKCLAGAHRGGILGGGESGGRGPRGGEVRGGHGQRVFFFVSLQSGGL
jgi:hypothetical protein